MGMIARRCVPSPTFLFSSWASTLKRSLRPSISTSSARTVTFWPFGVAPKCLTWTSKPTVVCPSGRCACTASMPARSIKPIMLGVDSTPSPPMCLTTNLSSTVVMISALSPSVRRSVAMLSLPMSAQDCLLAHASKQAAIDGDGRTGGVATTRRDQEGHHGGDVGNRADAAHRHLGLEFGAHQLWVGAARAKHLLKPRGVDVTRADGIDVDVVLGDFQAQGLGIADNAGPGCNRQAETGDRLDGGNGRNIEDGAATVLRDHPRDCGARHAHDV